MMKALLFLVSLLTTSSLAMSQEVATAPVNPLPSVKEASSGELFPLQWTASKGIMHQLVSTGIRKKFIFKVYAFGLYLDQAEAQKILEKWRKISPKKLATNEKFLASLLGGKIGMTVRWVMTRDVDAEDIAEAFADGLEPRLKELLKTPKGASEEDQAVWAQKRKNAAKDLQTFRNFFPKEEMEEEAELVFSWIPGGIFRTTLNSVQKMDIKSPVLGKAFFDIYLGTDPIARIGRESFLDALGDFLKPAQKSHER